MSFMQTSAIVYALLFVVIAFTALFIPSLLVTGAKPSGVARAISCYLWKTFGLLLVAMSVVQLTMDLLQGILPDAPVQSALILLFTVGVGIMVQASRILRSVDDASSVVVRLVFTHTCEVVGGLVALVSLLSIALQVLMTSMLVEWQLPVATFLLGLVTMYIASMHIHHKNGGGRKRRK